MGPGGAAAAGAEMDWGTRREFAVTRAKQEYIMLVRHAAAAAGGNQCECGVNNERDSHAGERK